MFHNTLQISTIDTPSGEMTMIADSHTIHLLQFSDLKNLNQEIESIRFKTDSTLSHDESDVIRLLKDELKLYFEGKLFKFETPINFSGTEFQKSVWEEAISIEYGITKSYEDLSIILKKPRAFRTVANALSNNHILLLIPCHRIINKSGGISGYKGGVERKKWLSEHEKKHRQN